METALVEIEQDTQKREPWDRLESDGETPAAYSRFVRFLHLGPRRSLLALHRAELAERAALAGARPKKPDSTPSSLRQLADRWEWTSRSAQFDLAELAADKVAYQQSRRERMTRLLETEFQDSQLMLDTAREALKTGHKFFDRRVVEKPVRVETDPVTGEKIRVIERVVFVEMKVSDINKMLMDGGKKARLATGLVSDKAQEAFVNNQADEYEDPAEVDREIGEMFRLLGVTNRVPQALPEGADSEADELPGDIQPPVNLTGELLPGFDY